MTKETKEIKEIKEVCIQVGLGFVMLSFFYSLALVATIL